MLDLQIKTQFKDSVLQTRINPSVKVNDGIYGDTNFHREIDGGAKTLNNIDLNTAFDKSKDHFINKIISDLSKI